MHALQMNQFQTEINTFDIETNMKKMSTALAIIGTER